MIVKYLIISHLSRHGMLQLEWKYSTNLINPIVTHYQQAYFITVISISIPCNNYNRTL